MNALVPARVPCEVCKAQRFGDIRGLEAHVAAARAFQAEDVRGDSAHLHRLLQGIWRPQTIQ